VVVEDDFPARAREIDRVLRPGLENIAKSYPDVVGQVAGVGALWGVFLQGGPKVLDLAGKLAPGFSSDPQFRTKLITLAVIAELFRTHSIVSYYSPNVENPLVVAPALVAEPADIEFFLDSLDKTLAKGLPRLLGRFVREKVAPRWPLGS
jgi:putrescine aminotransferase